MAPRFQKTQQLGTIGNTIKHDDHFKRLSVMCLAFFTVSGTFESFPIFRLLPLKLGYFALILPTIDVWREVIRTRTIPYAWLFIAGLVALMLPSITYVGYQSEKLLVVLTVIGAMSFISPVLLDDQRCLHTFFHSLAVLGTVIVAFTALNPQVCNERLIINEGNPIGLARAVSFTFFWVLLCRVHGGLQLVHLFVVGPAVIWIMISTGSKGPVVALLLATAVVFARHLAGFVKNRRFQIAVWFACLLSVPICWLLVKSTPRGAQERFRSFFSGQESDLRRRELYALSIDLIQQHRLGIGVGNFHDYSGRFYYPHNLILESFVELGWVFGAYFVLLMTICLATLWARCDSQLENQALLGFFVLALTNAMFSGDMTSPKELYIAMTVALSIFVRSPTRRPTTPNSDARQWSLCRNVSKRRGSRRNDRTAPGISCDHCWGVMWGARLRPACN